MSFFARLIYGARALFRKKKLERDMTEEMRFHLAQRTAENMEDGLSADEAQRAAQRSFGNLSSLQERAREVRGFLWLEQLLADARFAVRALRKNPGFFSVAVLTLALGIGATTALFTAVDAILLRPLPVPAASQLVYFGSGRNEAFSYPFYMRMREAAGSFSRFAAVQYRAGRREVILDGGTAESVQMQSVTGNFFTVLGVPALHGRALAENDDLPGAAQPVIVLSNAYWRRQFAANPAIIGRSVRLDHVPVTIVGVMPPEFVGFVVGPEPDFWSPLNLVAQLDSPQRNPLAEGVEWLVLFGRLRDGITREQAHAEVSGIFRRQLEDEVAWNPGRPSAERERILSRTLELHSGAAGFVSARIDFKQPLLVLMVAVSVVLLIACTNIAGLLLARGAVRQREFAVRAALGAGRARIIRQLVTESVLLALLGGVGGLLIARAGTQLLGAYLEQSGATMTLAPDARVFGFALAVSLCAGVLFGLAPAWRLSRLDLVHAINDHGKAVAGGRSRLQPLLVVAQVALAVLLLAGAGLFFRTLHNLRSADFGFAPDNLLSFRVDAGRWRPEAAQIAVLERRLLAELETLPGVRSVSIAGAGLLSGNGYRTDFAVEGYMPAPDEEMKAGVIFAGPRFFETLRVPLLRGREFTLADEPAQAAGGPPTAATVAIVGEALARKYFGDADPIGRHITRGVSNGVRLEVVGVAKDTKYSRNLRDARPLQFYLPYFGRGMRMPHTYYLRTEHSTAALAPAILRLITRIEPRLSVRDLRPMDEVIDRLLVRERIITQLVGFFSGFALLLAALGTYGVLAYNVTQRTREIGVRVALGATVRSIVGLVLRQGFGLVCGGAVLGLVAALGLTRYVAALLYDVKPIDPSTLAGVIALLAVVALVACWLPARRAAKVDPMVALRAE